MTTVAKADKSRLTIRGLIDGHQYIVFSLSRLMNKETLR